MILLYLLTDLGIIFVIFNIIKINYLLIINYL